MKFLVGAWFVLLSGILAVPQPEFSSIDYFRKTLVNVEADLLSQVLDPQRNEITTETESDLKVIESYKVFGDTLENRFPAVRDNHLHSLSSLWLWARAQSEMRGIEGLYTTFRRMQQEVSDDPTSINLRAWLDLSETILDDATASVPVALARIADLIVDQKLFISAYQASDICNEQQSQQQLLYTLYNTVALTELKGYSMMQFSWILLKLHDQGKFSEESRIMRQQYETRTNETLRAVRIAMAFAARDLWRCDPPQHKRDETFTELNQLLQSYIVNEVDLNSQSTCGENCAYYDHAKVHGCFKNQYCSQQRKCNGKIHNCQYIDSDMWICPSERKSARRYEYIEYENGRVLGKKGTCSRGTTKVDSWWRWLFWHCSYCVCSCDDHNSGSDRYFNMRDVIADIRQNKVITGIRFVKVNQIVHLQIQQSTLLPRGGIDATSLQWKSVEDYTISDPDVKNGVDYHTLSWEQRAIDLDDLVAPPGHLLTGVRFRKVGSHLNFEIMYTPFNFTTGTLIKPETRSVWHQNDNTDIPDESKPRTQLHLDKPDVPTSSLIPAIPDSKSDQYLLFTSSDLDKDAGQSTVPFLDIQPVVPNPPIPIAGAGIYHKGRKGFGGFVAPKLITYDFSPHLQATFPTPAPTVNKISVIPAMEVH